MNHRLSALFAATAALGLCAPAMASQPPAPAVACSDSVATIGNSGYLACQGPTTGNIAPGQVDTASFAGYGSFSLVGASNDPGAGPFVSDPGSVTSGTLTFDNVQKGFFVLGIKGGPDYSLYLFNGGSTGISSLKFDTLGITTGGGRAGPGLSHLALFTQPYITPSIPEPETYALMLGGLGLVGWLAGRRKVAD
jgi:hypothetical protein